MVDVKSKMCMHPGCTTRASFGVRGTRNLEFCARHAAEGMVDVVSKRCATTGCRKRTFYAVGDTKKGKFCRRHAQTGGTLFHSGGKSCAQRYCRAYLSVGKEGGEERDLFCPKHAKEGMGLMRNRRSSSSTGIGSIGARVGVGPAGFADSTAAARQVCVSHNERKALAPALVPPAYGNPFSSGRINSGADRSSISSERVAAAAATLVVVKSEVVVSS